MKLQCLSFEGKVTWFTENAKSQDFENEFKGFFHAKARGRGLLLSLPYGVRYFLLCSRF